jgi:hypothetical protein
MPAFGRLHKRSRPENRLHRPGHLPAACLRDYRDCIEGLRALANRDLLRHFSGHEEQDAARFVRFEDLKEDRRSQATPQPPLLAVDSCAQKRPRHWMPRS